VKFTIKVVKCESIPGYQTAVSIQIREFREKEDKNYIAQILAGIELKKKELSLSTRPVFISGEKLTSSAIQALASACFTRFSPPALLVHHEGCEYYPSYIGCEGLQTGSLVALGR
jgi:hypothetical protein